MGMAMQAKDLNITYETLFEILMREKDREELQKLDDGFVQSVNQYLTEKKEIVESKNTLDMFAADEREKTEKQIRNIYRIIKELYDRREKKITNMAIISARTGTGVIDTSSMMEVEKRLFKDTVAVLNSYRKEILLSMTETKAAQKEQEFSTPKIEQPAAIVVQQELKAEQPSEETKLLRFIHAVPKFLGRELEVYGPFDEEDIACLPEEIANVLITKGRAEEIKQTQS